jgi:hypothetical protein
MKYLVLAFVFAAGFATAHLTGLTAAADQPLPATPQAAPGNAPPNPNIDMVGFLNNAQAAAKVRESRRLTEEDFIKMSEEEGVIVLDARSKEMYDLLHIEGAINLSFPNIDIASLKKTLPDRNAKILIYCNNNFTPAVGQWREQQAQAGQQPNPMAVKAALAFPGKGAPMSLNLSTYIALHSYGYKNVYELGPLVNPTKTKLYLVSTKK